MRTARKQRKQSLEQAVEKTHAAFQIPQQDRAVQECHHASTLVLLLVKSELLNRIGVAFIAQTEQAAAAFV